jgi:hypothetical protein
LFVCATQWPWVLRPGRLWVNASVALADWLRLNENLVPTGGRRFALREITASAVPSHHLVCVWVTWVSTGATAAGTKLSVIVPVAVARARTAFTGPVQRKSVSDQARTMFRFTAVSGVHGANHFVLRRAGTKLQLLDTDTGAVPSRSA